VALAAPLLAGVPVFADDPSDSTAVIASDVKAGEESLGTEVCPPGVGVEDERAVTGECLPLSPDQPLIASVQSDEQPIREQSLDESAATESTQAIEPEPSVEPVER
jgi:hypothetical protein